MLFVIAATRLVREVRRAHLLVMLGIAAAVIVVSGVIFGVINHDGTGTGLYWAVTTASTVGYGDVTPSNSAARVLAVIVMVTVVPLVGAVFALLAGMSAATQLRRFAHMGDRLPTAGYTLVLGDHSVVASVLDSVVAAGDKAVLVAAERPAQLRADVGFRPGDPTDDAVVKAARPEQAGRAFVACSADADTLIVAVALRTAAPSLEIVALSESPRVAKALGDLGVTHTVSSTKVLAGVLARSLESADAGTALGTLIGSDDYRIRERAVTAEEVGRHVSALRGVPGALVLGVARDGGVDLGLTDDAVIADGDQLVELVARQQPPKKRAARAR